MKKLETHTSAASHAPTRPIRSLAKSHISNTAIAPSSAGMNRDTPSPNPNARNRMAEHQ